MPPLPSPLLCAALLAAGCLPASGTGPDEALPPAPAWVLPIEGTVYAQLVDLAAPPDDADPGVSDVVALVQLRGGLGDTFGGQRGADSLLLVWLDAAGQVVRVRKAVEPTYLPDFGTGAFELESLRITLDRSGGVTLVGAFAAAIWFHADQSDLPGAQSKGGLDLFVARWDAAGRFEGFVDTGSPADDRARCVVPLDDGELAIGGEFRGVLPLTPGQSVESVGRSDGLVGRVGVLGTVHSPLLLRGPGDDAVVDLVHLGERHLVVSAEFERDLSIGERLPLPGVGGRDALLVRLASDDSVAWALSAAGVGDDSAGRVVRVDDGVLWSVQLSRGGRIGSFTFADGGSIVARVAESGEVVWARQVAPRAVPPVRLAAWPDGRFVAAGDGVLSAHRADGAVAWRWPGAERAEFRAVVRVGAGVVVGGVFSGGSPFEGPESAEGTVQSVVARVGVE